MIYLLCGAFALYIVYKITLCLLEIGFVKKKSLGKAVVLDESGFKKAANVAITNQKFEIFSIIYSFFILLFWLFIGAKILWRVFEPDDSIGRNLLFVLAFLAINFILTLPLEIYSKFIKDKRLGFSNLTAKIFIIDTVKSIVVGAVFASILITGVLFCFEKLSNNWWIWAFVLSMTLVLVVNLIYPTVIAPLFNKMSPLDDVELKEAINSLLNSAGFKSSGVFIIDASKRDKRLNAYFGGLGATKRVVLFDTLIQKLSKNELLAVLAHELGHFAHKDIIKNIFMMAFVLFVTFWVLGNLPANLITSLGVGASGGSLLLFFMLFFPLLSAVFEPLISMFSRKHEFGADNFGANLTSKEDMASALTKLGSQNLSFPFSHPLYAAIYHSHPSLYERIEELKR